MAPGNDSTEVKAVPFQGDIFGTAEDYAIDIFRQPENENDDMNPGLDDTGLKNY